MRLAPPPETGAEAICHSRLQKTSESVQARDVAGSRRLVDKVLQLARMGQLLANEQGSTERELDAAGRRNIARAIVAE